MDDRMTTRSRGRARRMVGAMLALAMGAAGLTGCNNEAQERMALLDEENTQLRMELMDRNAALDSMQRELDAARGSEASLQATLSERDRELQSARAAREAAPADPFSQIPGVTGRVGGGEITAVVEGDVLFASGQSTVRSASKRTLDEVARVLRREYPGKTIRVSGHTDSDPIRKSKDRYATNYHLGFERAFAVREYLIDRGISADRISISSYGPDQPMRTKEQSRRVEIAVVTG